MLNLFILRHGKAVNTTDSESDFDRKLNKKGNAQINQIGYILKNDAQKIDQIIASGAKRTTETAEIINFYLQTGAIHFDDALYLTHQQKILEILKSEARSKSILLTGHNFGLSNFVNYLTGENLILSTGMLVQINFNFDDWKLLNADTGQIEHLIKPQVHTF